MSECYLCGTKLIKNKNRSKDHVPPDCIFPNKKPDNLITVPCCINCNQIYKSIDEKMRNYIAMIANEKSGEVGEKAKKEVLRSSKLKLDFIRHMKEYRNLRDENGILQYFFEFDESELDKWLIRLTKGLHYKKFKERLPEKASFETNKYPILIPQASETFPLDDGLEFRPYFVYGVLDSNFWVFIFYDHLIFSVTVNL